MRSFVRILATTLSAIVPSIALAAATPPTLFVTGDSTASAYDANPKNQQGWGAVLQPLFDEKKLRVVDVARGGRSSRTFITEGHWDAMLARCAPAIS
jgi:lysophospholipase L1-like esterase